MIDEQEEEPVSEKNGNGLVWRLLTLAALAVALVGVARAELFVAELQRVRAGQTHVEQNVEAVRSVQAQLIPWVNRHQAAATKAEQTEKERQAHLLAIEAAKEELRREAVNVLLRDSEERHEANVAGAVKSLAGEDDGR